MSDRGLDRMPEMELIAVVVAIADGVPVVLVSDDLTRLPSGPLMSDHRSLQAALRSWVEDQTGLTLGFVEQLYTFADLDRSGPTSHRSLSISYLALTCLPDARPGWREWYEFFPWEDRRREADLSPAVSGALGSWAEEDGSGSRWMRLRILFGWDEHPWLPELALQRYEVLYEAGLVAESQTEPLPGTGHAMFKDHRRILATGISRLRSKIQYRPVIFEAMPELFTLGRLQQSVEAIAGQMVHKQNFRRLVMSQELVEPTGVVTHGTGGRPAKTYRFRTRVRDERAVTGTKIPRSR